MNRHPRPSSSPSSRPSALVAALRRQQRPARQRPAGLVARRTPSVAQGSPDVTPAPSDEPPTAVRRADRLGRARAPARARARRQPDGHHARPGLLLARRPARQRGPRRRPPRGPRHEGRRDGRGERAPRRPDRRPRRGRAITHRVPAGSQLLGLTIDDGVATVDLSSEFESGGGSAVGPDPARPGRLHPDPVPDREVGRLPDRGRDETVFSSEGSSSTAGHPRRLRRAPARHLGRPAGVQRRDRQPGPRDRQRQRLRGHVPDRRSSTARQGRRRRAGHGQLRHRLPRARSTRRSVHRQQGPVRDPPGLQPVGQGRHARVDPRLPGLADAEGLTPSRSHVPGRPGSPIRGVRCAAARTVLGQDRGMCGQCALQRTGRCSGAVVCRGRAARGRSLQIALRRGRPPSVGRRNVRWAHIERPGAASAIEPGYATQIRRPPPRWRASSAIAAGSAAITRTRAQSAASSGVARNADASGGTNGMSDLDRDRRETRARAGSRSGRAGESARACSGSSRPGRTGRRRASCTRASAAWSNRRRGSASATRAAIGRERAGADDAARGSRSSAAASRRAAAGGA